MTKKGEGINLSFLLLNSSFPKGKDFFIIEQLKLIEKQDKMIEKLICQFFSGRCQLKSLRIDISNELRGGVIHSCLAKSNLLSRLNTNRIETSCQTLTYLHIRLNEIYILRNLIEHLPNLEQLFIESTSTLGFLSEQPQENWFNKVRKNKNAKKSFALVFI